MTLGLFTPQAPAGTGPRFLPRPYQIEAKAATLSTWADGDAALLVQATGTGKTLTGLFIAEDFLARGERVVWLAHREELLDQPLAELKTLWPQFKGGIVQAHRDQPDAAIVFASVDTLRNPDRLAAILEHGSPALVVVDEAHHSTTRTQQAAIQGLCTATTRRLGLTATPDRDDGQDLGAYWTIAFSYSLADAIADGWLVTPYAAVEVLPDLDLSGVSGAPVDGDDYESGGRRRDYDDAELGAALLLQGIVEHTVAQMARAHLAEVLPDRGRSSYLSAPGRHALVYTATVEQARLTAEALSAPGGGGWRARWVSGETARADRRRLLAAFKAGEIDCLCSAAVLTEGTDLPIADLIVLARPTRSWPLYVQIVGRGARLHDPDWRREWGLCNALDPRYVDTGGKSAFLVLDLAGATREHNLVAAPVLIGKGGCPNPAGHEWEPDPDKDQWAGRCVHHFPHEPGADKDKRCRARIPCLASGGPHAYTDAHFCSACGKPRCVGARNRPPSHAWVPAGAGGLVFDCLDCGATSRDPHIGMLSPAVKGETSEADWLRVPGVTPETWAVDVGDHGLLLVAGDRAAGTWRPFWIPKGGRKARPLTAAPVARELVRTYADDLVSRAARLTKSKGPVTEAQRAYLARLGVQAGGFDSTGRRVGPQTAAEAARAIVRTRARERAIATGVAAPADPTGAASLTTTRPALT